MTTTNSLNLARRFGPVALVDPEAFHAHLATCIQRTESLLSLGKDVLAQVSRADFRSEDAPFKNDSDAIPEFAKDWFPEQHDARFEGTTAIIPIRGAIDRQTTTMERLFYGLADTDRIAFNFRVADQHPDVEAIILDVDSPGGNAQGIHETASMIAAASKPVFAQTDGLMCSAAYYLAAGAREIAATPSATVGSIGTYILHYDVSRMLEDMGVSVELFASGELKGAGAQGVPLTDQQRAMIQERVKQHSEMFFGFVDEHRGTDAEQLQGGAFLGEQAVKLGLVDKLV